MKISTKFQEKKHTNLIQSETQLKSEVRYGHISWRWYNCYGTQVGTDTLCKKKLLTSDIRRNINKII